VDAGATLQAYQEYKKEVVEKLRHEAGDLKDSMRAGRA
jgi:hypothetical protein